MPAVTIYYPRNFFDATDKVRFKRAVKLSVAANMDAINPETKEMTRYGLKPNDFIDLVLVPYDHDDADVTTPFLGTIVTYDWPDRMVNIGDRIKAITKEVRAAMPRDRFDPEREAISFTFLGKVPGAWFAA